MATLTDSDEDINYVNVLVHVENTAVPHFSSTDARPQQRQSTTVCILKQQNARWIEHRFYCCAFRDIPSHSID